MSDADHSWLVTLIERHFSAEGTLGLCQDLQVEAEDFSGTPDDYPRQLVAQLARQQRLPDLLTECRHLCPYLQWMPQDVARRRLPFPRNPAFTGREALLDAIHSTFSIQHSPFLVLSGLGGVGKTQITLEYTHRHWQEYAVIGCCVPMTP